MGERSMNSTSYLSIICSGRSFVRRAVLFLLPHFVVLRSRSVNSACWGIYIHRRNGPWFGQAPRVSSREQPIGIVPVPYIAPLTCADRGYNRATFYLRETGSNCTDRGPHGLVFSRVVRVGVCVVSLVAFVAPYV